MWSSGRCGVWHGATVLSRPFADLDAAAIALGTANGIPFWKQRLRLKSVSSVVEKYSMKTSEVTAQAAYHDLF